MKIIIEQGVQLPPDWDIRHIGNASPIRRTLISMGIGESFQLTIPTPKEINRIRNIISSIHRDRKAERRFILRNIEGTNWRIWRIPLPRS